MQSLHPLLNRYLERQPGLSPASFGRGTWSQVQPNSTRFGVTGAVAKAYYYHTARFSAVATATAFARGTTALEAVFYKGMPAYANFNNFAGRSYTPQAGRGNETSAAFLSPDWFEMGRSRGATLLWTEDWFGDVQVSDASTDTWCATSHHALTDQQSDCLSDWYLFV